MLTCTVFPTPWRRVHSVLIRRTHLDERIPAPRTFRQAQAPGPASPHHPWKAPFLQSLVSQQRWLAPYLRYLAGKWWTLGYLCGRRKTRLSLGERPVPGYLREWDIYSGTGPGFFWGEFHWAIFGEHDGSKHLEFMPGQGTDSDAFHLFTYLRSDAVFQLAGAQFNSPHCCEGDSRNGEMPRWV